MSGQFSLRPILPTFRPRNVCEQRELRLLIGRRVQCETELADLLDLRQQPVLGVEAGLGRGADLRRRGDQAAEIRHRHQLRWLDQDPVRDQVPVVAEQPRERPEVLELDADRHREQQRLGDRIVVEELLLQLGPAFLEGDRRADLVEYVDQRRQPGLDRMREQDLLRERVQCADRRGIQVVERSVGQLPVLALPRPLELDPQPVPELRPGLLGERHGGDRSQRYAVSQHQRADPLDQRMRLPGPGACLDEEGGVGVRPDPVPSRPVEQLLTHRRPPEQSGR